MGSAIMKPLSRRRGKVKYKNARDAADKQQMEHNIGDGHTMPLSLKENAVVPIHNNGVSTIGDHLTPYEDEDEVRMYRPMQESHEPIKPLDTCTFSSDEEPRYITFSSDEEPRYTVPRSKNMSTSKRTSRLSDKNNKKEVQSLNTFTKLPQITPSKTSQHSCKDEEDPCVPSFSSRSPVPPIVKTHDFTSAPTSTKVIISQAIPNTAVINSLYGPLPPTPGNKPKSVSTRSSTGRPHTITAIVPLTETNSPESVPANPEEHSPVKSDKASSVEEIDDVDVSRDARTPSPEFDDLEEVSIVNVCGNKEGDAPRIEQTNVLITSAGAETNLNGAGDNVVNIDKTDQPAPEREDEQVTEMDHVTFIKPSPPRCKAKGCSHKCTIDATETSEPRAMDSDDKLNKISVEYDGDPGDLSHVKKQEDRHLQERPNHISSASEEDATIKSTDSFRDILDSPDLKCHSKTSNKDTDSPPTLSNQEDVPDDRHISAELQDGTVKKTGSSYENENIQQVVKDEQPDTKSLPEQSAQPTIQDDQNKTTEPNCTDDSHERKLPPLDRTHQRFLRGLPAFSLPRLGHIQPAKTSKGRELAEKEPMEDKHKTHNGQNEQNAASGNSQDEIKGNSAATTKDVGKSEENVSNERPEIPFNNVEHNDEARDSSLNASDGLLHTRFIEDIDDLGQGVKVRAVRTHIDMKNATPLDQVRPETEYKSSARSIHNAPDQSKTRREDDALTPHQTSQLHCPKVEKLNPEVVESIQRQLLEEGLKPSKREGGVSFFLPLAGDGLQPSVLQAGDISERITKGKKPPLTHDEKMLLANVNREAQLSKRKKFAVRDIQNVRFNKQLNSSSPVSDGNLTGRSDKNELDPFDDFLDD